MKTHFEKILEFNKAFGVQTNKNPTPPTIETKKLINYRLSLIQEEFDELKDAIKDNDFAEIIDALADIEYVVLGFYTAIGIDADKAFDIVHKSNMSKLCKTEEEAKNTVKYYIENQDKHGYDSPKYRLSDDHSHFVVYNESTSKILKSINYTPANFDELISGKKSENVFKKVLDNIV